MPVTLRSSVINYKDPTTGNYVPINAVENGLSETIAPDYSDLTFPVAEGKLCYHAGSLYKTNQDIATSEDWTAAHWDETTVEEEINGRYTKPSSGIPASDIADGVIPDPEDLIDDEAGEGDTDKVWSADKIAEELSRQNGAINAKADEPTGTKAAGKVYGLNSNLEPVWVEQSGGGSVDPEDIAQAVADWCDENITNPDSPPLDRSLTSASAAAPADIVGTATSKMERIDIEASANKWDKTVAQVGMLHTNGRVYTGGTYDNYVYGVKLPVQQGDVVRLFHKNSSGTAFTSGTIVRVASYDASGTIMSSSGSSETTAFTVPSGVASIAITIHKTYNDFGMIIFNDDTVPTEYIPYREADAYYVATEEFIPDNIIRQYINDKVDKDGVEQVTAKNCKFVKYSPNLFDTSSVETGLLNKSTGVVLPSYTTYVTSDWIEVDSSTNYTFSAKYNPYIYWVWYNSSKGWISGGENSMATEPTKQSPANAKYIRFSILAELLYNDIQLEKGSTASSYMAYGTGYIQPEYMPPEAVGVTFNIPKKVYALVGYETNIYFENLVEDWTKYSWDVICEKGMHMERCFRITPTETDVGTYTLTFRLSVGNHTESFSTTLAVVSGSAGSGVSESVIVLGDSTTANGIAVTKLNANLASDVYNISTIGTKGTAPNKHEGRSGWRFSTYFSNNTDNAFYNPSTQTFDASYYFTNSGVAKPDWFFINLGINDVFGFTNDSMLADGIAQCKEYLDSMIESINDASPSTKIGICLTIPPNHSQDAFGKEYKCNQDRNRYKRNNLLWVNAVIADYDDREAEGIYLIPIYAALDTVYNMGFETLPVNARNTTITYESPIGNGGVHPVESGYWQIADVYAAFLKGNAT